MCYNKISQKESEVVIMASPKLANLMKSFEDAFADTPAGSSLADEISSLAAARSSYNEVARQARADAKAMTYQISKATDAASEAALLYMAQQMQSFAGAPSASAPASKKTAAKPAKKPVKSAATKQPAASSSQSSEVHPKGSDKGDVANDDMPY